jgi:protein SCO1/2
MKNLIESKWSRPSDVVTSWTAAANVTRCRFAPQAESDRPRGSTAGSSLCGRGSGIRVALLALALGIAGGSAFAANPGRTPDHDYDAPKPGSYQLPVIKPAADGEVLDVKGRSLRLRELTRGRVTVISFIYTRCAAAKACPMATGVLMQLHQQSAADPALAKGLRLVSMSFDPEEDTPERMAAYSALADGRKPAAEWRFITTRSQAELQPILQAYGQAVNKKENPKDPSGPLNHTLRVFLIDREGNLRNIYSSGTLDPRLVLADIRTLMMEKNTAAKK